MEQVVRRAPVLAQEFRVFFARQFGVGARVHEKQAAGFQYPPDFLEELVRMSHVANDVVGRHHVERIVGIPAVHEIAHADFKFQGLLSILGQVRIWFNALHVPLFPPRAVKEKSRRAADVEKGPSLAPFPDFGQPLFGVGDIHGFGLDVFST